MQTLNFLSGEPEMCLLLSLLSRTDPIAYSPGKFPSHLDELVFKGSPADYIKAFRPVRPGMAGDTHLYKATFEPPKPKTLTSEANVDTNLKSVGTKQEINIEMAGNWLIRWTATDSDLPFAFMRAYHRQLSNYLPLYQPDSSEALSTSQLVTAPGYVFIAGTLLEVCDALIHRNLRSVTTVGFLLSFAKYQVDDVLVVDGTFQHRCQRQ